MRKGTWDSIRILSDRIVSQITPYLDDGESSGKPHQLLSNAGKSYIGVYPMGAGFVLDRDEYETLLRIEACQEIIQPFLNGDDLNSRADQSASRLIINFRDWPLGRWGQRLQVCGETIQDVIRSGDPTRFDNSGLNKSVTWRDSEVSVRKRWLQLGVVPADYPEPVAADYPLCLSVLERRVRPERAKANDQLARRIWWRFFRTRGELYSLIAPLDRCLARSVVSAYHNFVWIPTNIAMSHAIVVIATDRAAMFAILQSSFHNVWLEQNASSLRTDVRYTPSDCFETFPMPALCQDLDRAGDLLDCARQEAMHERRIGLTAVAQVIGDPACNDTDVQHLRSAIVDTDEAVRAAYGWLDLNLEHGFYGEGRARRFTVSPSVRSEMLRRLLKLNRERYEAESKPSLDGAMKVAEKRAAYDAPIKGGLFGSGDWDEVEA